MKDIFGYEGIYAITEDGRVWSYKRKRFKSLTEDLRGYLRVNLSKNGSTKTYSVHRLVAETYLPNPNQFSDVNHLDENKGNNHVSNLEWCSHKYNVNYGTRTSRIVEKRMKSIYCVELDQVFDSFVHAARITGIHKGNICQCCKGNLKTAGGYHWKYCEE